MAPVSLLSTGPQVTTIRGSLPQASTDASSVTPSSIVDYPAASIGSTNGGAASFDVASTPEAIDKILHTRGPFVEVTPTPTDTPVPASTALQVIEASPTHVGMVGQTVTLEQAKKAVKEHHNDEVAFRILRHRDPATQYLAIVSMCIVSGLALGGVVCCVIECMERKNERKVEELKEQVKKSK